jgi:hypothetical protein
MLCAKTEKSKQLQLKAPLEVDSKVQGKKSEKSKTPTPKLLQLKAPLEAEPKVQEKKSPVCCDCTFFLIF